MGYPAATQGPQPFIDTTIWEKLSDSKSLISKSSSWIYAYFLIMFNPETVLKEQDLKEETSDGHRRVGERVMCTKCASSRCRLTDADSPNALPPLMMSCARLSLDDISVLHRVNGLYLEGQTLILGK